MCFVQQQPMSILAEPIQTLEFDFPEKILTALEPEKPRRCRTAYNLFFRDERQKIFKLLSSRGKGQGTATGQAKMTFNDMARTLSIKWRAMPEFDKYFYKMLAEEEKKRFESEMEVWQVKVKEHTAQQARIPACAASIELPSSLESIFDDEEGDDIELIPEGISINEAYIPGAQSRLIVQQCAAIRNKPVSDTTETKHDIGQAGMETVYGAMPSLLGDIGDDAPWPF